jgi:hypothetical protein
MAAYIEVEDVKEIARLNIELGKKLRDAFPQHERRIIGWPNGSFPATIYFMKADGNEVFWWSPRTTKDKKAAQNFFGRGVPGEKNTVNIDVQFNVPLKTFTRSFGGAFIKDKKTGRVFLAHHGIVTLGKARLRKNEVFDTIDADLCDVDTSKGDAAMIRVIAMDSTNLAAKLSKFAHEMRRTVQAIAAQKPTRAQVDTARTKNSEAMRTVADLSRLNKYFEEFRGSAKVNQRAPCTADYHHGDVVSALAKHYQNSLEVLKNQLIDLVVQSERKVLLFEVKSSSTTQSIYTAIGQLFTHEPAVKLYLPGWVVERVMVLPKPPREKMAKVLADHLGIHVTTFIRHSKNNVTFTSLPKV